MDVRKRKKQMELLWRGSESLGDTAELFTGNFASGNYGPPPGFNWDWGQADPQMQVLDWSGVLHACVSITGLCDNEASCQMAAS